MTYCWKYSQNFHGLEEIDNIPKVHISLDYTERTNYENQNRSFKKDKYDLIFGISNKSCKLIKKK
jgi:basic membrane lipoprotein Med (substrate-binding protein (PBP1-ABC) superfamily)